jgi:WD40 repeat protein
VYAIGCDAPEVLLFHAGRRHTIGEPLFTSGGVKSLAFSSPDGRHIAAGLVDGGLQVRGNADCRLI